MTNLKVFNHHDILAEQLYALKLFKLDIRGYDWFPWKILQSMGNLDALGFSAKHFDGFKMLYIYCFIDMLIIIYLLWEEELK